MAQAASSRRGYPLSIPSHRSQSTGRNMVDARKLHDRPELYGGATRGLEPSHGGTPLERYVGKSVAKRT